MGFTTLDADPHAGGQSDADGTRWGKPDSDTVGNGDVRPEPDAHRNIHEHPLSVRYANRRRKRDTHCVARTDAFRHEPALSHAVSITDRDREPDRAIRVTDAVANDNPVTDANIDWNHDTHGDAYAELHSIGNG